MGAPCLQALASQNFSYQSKLLGLRVDNSPYRPAPVKPVPPGPSWCSMLKRRTTVHQRGIKTPPHYHKCLQGLGQLLNTPSQDGAGDLQRARLTS